MSAEQRQWLGKLYESNFAAVVKRGNAILRSREDAADAAHEVFLIALNSLEPDADPKRARAWLLTVAHNHCLDLVRRRQRFGRALITLGSEGEASADVESGVANRDFLDRVMRQLSGRERLALWESAVEHRPLADIASGLHLSYAAAAQVVHRARQRAVRLAAGAAVIVAGIRLPRALRRFLHRVQLTDVESLATIQRTLVVAALPLVAAVTLQSSASVPSYAGATGPDRQPVVVGSSRGESSVPGGFGELLSSITATVHSESGARSPALLPQADLPNPVKSLRGQVESSLGQLLPVPPSVVPSTLPLPTAAPSLAVPIVPPLASPSVPPAPSLPSPGH
jgi:RNA polymerase sigma-70 factor (ECF subfamily)